FLHLGKIAGEVSGFNPLFFAVLLELPKEFRRVEERLRRDAADVEAGAAQGQPFFDADGLQTELRCADRGDIAAGTGSNDGNIKPHRSNESRAGSSWFFLIWTKKAIESFPPTIRWSKLKARYMIGRISI